MNGPKFWYKPIGFWAALLGPLGFASGFLTLRKRGMIKGLPVPTVIIKTIDTKGADKTPALIAAAERVQQMGYKPLIFVKGQGATVQVDPKRHGPNDVGAAGLLLSSFCPTICAQNLQDVGSMVQQLDADIVLTGEDITVQPPHKSISILMVDAHRGFGNGLCRPAGPLRLPLRAALKHIDLVLPIGAATAQARFAQCWDGKLTKPQMAADLRPIEMGMQWKGLRVLAFAGADRPDHFFTYLRRLGADIVSAQAFAKGEEYTPAILQRMTNEAKLKKLQIVTTEKDAQGLPQNIKAQVLSLPLRLYVDDWVEFDRCVSAAQS